ncbi:MAG TPA: YkgJ family cysteine cluster protein [Puia sp.]|nr:YkgJ family cysteine cluster protein [Puia sp.]
MGDILQDWEKKTFEHQKQYQYFLQKADKNKADKNKVLRQLPDLHEEAFERIDCTKCANCCKNYSPRFKGPDIKRISKSLQMKEGDFIDKYLVMDDEGDYVTRSKPCPFLGADNLCGIYDARPSDCQRFPYTDEDIILKRPRVTIKNSTFCPIVYFVLEKLIAAGI